MTDKPTTPTGVVSNTELGTDPKCDRCGAPITTGMMALMCPHGRQCALVDGDDQWQTIEDLRIDFGIERVKLPNAPGEHHAKK